MRQLNSLGALTGWTWMIALSLVMINGIGAHLTNDERRAHLTDLPVKHLIDQISVREILLPES
jgi:hypothetical protein